MRFPEYIYEHIENKNELINISETIYGIASHIEEQKKDALNKSLTLLIVSGLTGAGKDTIVNSLIEKDKRFGWIRTCTTRPRRPEETEENDTYIRLTEDAYQKALACGDVVECVEYAGNHYCSLTSIFEKAFEKYEVPVLRIEPRGSRFYSELWKKGEWLFNKVNLVYIFVVTPTVDTLRERLLNRSNDPAFVEKRIAQTSLDIPFVNDSQYIVINENGQLESVMKDLNEKVLS